MIFKKVALKLSRVDLQKCCNRMITVSPISYGAQRRVSHTMVTWTWRPYVMTVLVNPLQANGHLLFPKAGHVWVAVRLKLCQDHMGPTRTPLRCPPLDFYLSVHIVFPKIGGASSVWQPLIPPLFVITYASHGWHVGGGARRVGDRYRMPFVIWTKIITYPQGLALRID